MKKSELKKLIKEEANKILVPRRSREERAKKDKRPPSLDRAFDNSPNSAPYENIFDIILSYKNGELTNFWKEVVDEGRWREDDGNIKRSEYNDFFDSAIYYGYLGRRDDIGDDTHLKQAQINWISISNKEEAEKWADELRKEQGL